MGPWSRGADTVIVSLQRTQLDDQCSVRIFAKIDDFAKLLCEEMKTIVPEQQVPEIYTFTGENQEEKYVIPYDGETGEKNVTMEESRAAEVVTSVLNLEDGAIVRLTMVSIQKRKRACIAYMEKHCRLTFLFLLPPFKP